MATLNLGKVVGDTGPQGPQGIQGEAGPQGEAGKDGQTPYIGENGNWWIGETDTGVKAQGPAGKDGTGAGTVTGIMIGTETYEPDDTGVVELPETGGAGVPDGGTTGQMLFKTGDEDGAAQWQTPTHDKVGALGSDPQEEESTEAPELGSVPINADKLGGFSLADIMLKLYPVGAIYTSTVETNPETLFGGTWEQIKGRFLIGTGAPENNDDGTSPGSYNYAAGSKGGEAETTIINSMLPYWTGMAKTAESDGEWSLGKWMDHGANEGDMVMSFMGNEAEERNNLGNMPPYLSVYMWKRVS